MHELRIDFWVQLEKLVSGFEFRVTARVPHPGARFAPGWGFLLGLFRALQDCWWIGKTKGISPARSGDGASLELKFIA